MSIRSFTCTSGRIGLIIIIHRDTPHYFTVSKTVITIETGGIGGATLPVMISKLIALRHEETSAESLVAALDRAVFFTATAQAVTATTTGLIMETTAPRPPNTFKTTRA